MWHKYVKPRQNLTAIAHHIDVPFGAFGTFARQGMSELGQVGKDRIGNPIPHNVDLYIFWHRSFWR